MRVLVVDDSRAMRMIIRRELRTGADIDEVTEAEDAPSALRLLEDDSFDLVISDWNMPGMTGIEFLETLRGKGYDGSFAFITSESGEGTRLRALEAGAAFLLTKPFTGSDLAKEIAALGGSGSGDSPQGPEDGERTVTSVLEGLLRKPVTAVRSEPPSRRVARAMARYHGPTGKEVAVFIAEIGFAASAGAALSLLPPTAAAEWARAGVMTEMIEQNFFEVANVLASVVNPKAGHCTLREVELLADFEKPRDHERLTSAAQQVNLQLTIAGYQPGRVALIAFDDNAA